MELEVALCVAILFTHVLLSDDGDWENALMGDLAGVPSRKSEKSFKPEPLQV